ncbi:MAG: flagellar biosynthetic protein FliR [candidate division WOR-3 bacterium]
MIELKEWYIFLLLFLRASFIVFFLPVISSRYVPNAAKVALSFFLAYMGFLYVAVTGLTEHIVLPTTIVELIVVVLRELVFGFTVASICRLVFNAVELAGEYISYLMGLSIVNVVDPYYERMVPIVSHFQTIVAMLIFLVIGGHEWFFYAYRISIDVVPITGSKLVEPSVIGDIIPLLGTIYTMAVIVGAPLLIVMMIVQFSLALISRMLPQLNVFMVGFPLQLIVGFWTLFISTSAFNYVVSKIFVMYRDIIFQVIRLF